MDDGLAQALAARGAALVEWQGVRLPAHFGDVGREWRAAREGAALFDASFRTFVAAGGEDRVAFLHGMLSNDVKGLAAGQGVYAALLNQQGKVVSDLRVYAEAQRLLLDVPAWRATLLRESLERFLVADDVELTVPLDSQPLLGLEGPLAAAVAGEALGTDGLPREPLAQTRLAFQGEPLLVVRVSQVEGQGLLLCGPASVAARLFDACREAGALPAGMQALDMLRVEAGAAWAGLDMDEDTLIQETGRDAALSFSKGCYLGQEVVERIAARGHVNRHLGGLVLAGDRLPAPGAPLLAEDREVGYVSSAVRSEALGRPIALAMIHRKHSAAGHRLTTQIDGAPVTATVVALPFDPAAIS
jgi:folate-binding protein YgfZ